MLAAAIRASLIEAGEPDTSQQITARPSPHPDSFLTPLGLNEDHKQKEQQQQQAGLPVSSSASASASPFQTSAAQQHTMQQQHPDQWQEQQQQQQQGQKHHLRFEEKPLNVKTLLPEHNAAAMHFGGLAAALQDADLASTSGQALRQGPNGLSERPLRTAKSIDGVMDRSSQVGGLEDASNSGEFSGRSTSKTIQNLHADLSVNYTVSGGKC